MERAKGFEPSTQNSQGSQPQGVPNDSTEGYTQIRAQISEPIDHELAKVVEAWPALSRPLKAAILSIVAASNPLKEGQP